MPPATQRLVEELGQRAGTNYVGVIPQNARTGAQITVESHLGRGARWSYWSQDVSPSPAAGRNFVLAG